jgi:uncharacterized protein YaiE (UPF0345 family)
LSFGALIVAGTDASDIALRIQNASSTSVYFYVWGDGRVQINNIPNATTDTDRFLVSDNGVIKYRTGAQLLSDIGGASASGYVPYTGATANLDLGTHTLIAAKGTFSSSGSGDTVGITHSSGSGIALNITKGGSGEGLYINKTSGSGNAATIIGTLNATTLVKSGGTSSQFLKADGSVDSTSYGTGSVTSVGLSSATSGVTIASTPITTSGNITIDIANASGSQNGLLSSTDWTTFNNKQNALTNPVTGTGTTNYLPKFTGTSAIGDSIVQESGTTITIGGNLNSTGNGTTSALLTNNNGSGAQHYQDFGNGAGFVSGRILRGNGASGLEGNGLNIDSYEGFKVRLNQLGGSGGSFTIDGGNLGLGVTPSAWSSAFGSVLQFKSAGSNGGGSLTGSGGSNFRMFANTFYDGSYKYIVNGTATQYEQDGYHAWFTAPSGTAGNAISFTQAMTLNASGFLGIGTTSPAERLSVAGAIMSTGGITGHGANRTTISQEGGSGAFWQSYGANTTTVGAFVLRQASSDFSVTRIPLSIDTTGAATFSSSVTAGAFLTNASSGAAGQEGLRINNDNGYIGFFNGANNTRSGYLQGNTTDVTLTTSPSTPLIFGTANVEKMRITSAGNVGIGTTSPFSQGTSPTSLEIAGANFGQLFVSANSGAARGTLMARNGTSDVYIGAITNSPLAFGTNDTERMRITSGGTLCVKRTSAPSSAYSMAIQEAIMMAVSTNGNNMINFFNQSDTYVSSIVVNSSTVMYNTVSDYRLKEDLKSFKGLDLVSKINVYDYKWKSDGSRMYGVVAHELQEILPDAVSGLKDALNKDGSIKNQGVDYSKIVPVMVQAIKDLKQELDTLKNK